MGLLTYTEIVPLEYPRSTGYTQPIHFNTASMSQEVYIRREPSTVIPCIRMNRVTAKVKEKGRTTPTCSLKLHDFRQSQ